MPVVSQKQNAAMHAAAEGRSTLGIPQSVGQEFVNASQGENVKALPKKKKPAASDRARRLHSSGMISNRAMNKAYG